MHIRLSKSKEPQAKRTASLLYAEQTRIPSPAKDVHSLLQLQRRYGNRYVQRVLASVDKTGGKAAAGQDMEEGEREPEGATLVDQEGGVSTRRSAPGTVLQRQADIDQAPPGLPCVLATNLAPATGTSVVFGVSSSAVTAAHRATVASFVTGWQAGGSRDEILVSGYASREGPQSLNWRLSCDRAEAVKTELGNQGVPANRVQTWAHGPTTAFSNTSLSPNRRAVISTTPSAAPPTPAPPPLPPLTVRLPGRIRAASTPAAMPADRIPPRVDTPVNVQISGWRIPMRDVTLAIEGAGGGNGTATINGVNTYDLNTTQTVRLRGVNQTSPGSAGNLRLVARQGGTMLARSGSFSVAAIPQNFSITFHSLITGARRGIRVNNNWESDSGVLADLNEAERSEQVQYGAGTGIFVGVVGANSGYRPAHIAPRVDQHGIAAAALTGSGSLTAEQVFIFLDRRTGVRDIPVTNSGFRITRVATRVPILGWVFFTTSKAGTATTANGYTSAAGRGSVSRTQIVW
jgi:outer membrane protein OmpA-like peptidoglycan-associated protein